MVNRCGTFARRQFGLELFSALPGRLVILSATVILTDYFDTTNLMQSHVEVQGEPRKDRWSTWDGIQALRF
jgi:hypothetical protein